MDNQDHKDAISETPSEEVSLSVSVPVAELISTVCVELGQEGSLKFIIDLDDFMQSWDYTASVFNAYAKMLLQGNEEILQMLTEEHFYDKSEIFTPVSETMGIIESLYKAFILKETKSVYDALEEDIMGGA